ncbi:zinc transporter ZIP13 homolog isoform X5 [Bombus pyrosoma]|uniref:zinc transporter ZIP13 homolog isoform X5 n=1 Tax=Bombus pyrosoma TaxID=396416 RepID=UPI001CB9A5CB|nr:zinc transporter ZIP13 homolog isoform X5 [Bombus pyrosoma]
MAVFFAWKYPDWTDWYFPPIYHPHSRRCQPKDWSMNLLNDSYGINDVFLLQGILTIAKGDSANTLKVLLSFAVGGLLGDVFLHLLPETWANSSLNKADDRHPSMTCGLWVLGGFLVFVIVEKLFAFEQETEIEDTSINNTELCEKTSTEAEKEMENNNCINLIGSNPKNGFSKRLPNEFSKAINELRPFLEKKSGYSELSNDFKDNHRNGFISNGIKPVLMCNELSNTLKGLPLNEAKDCLKKLAKNANGFSTELSRGYLKKDKAGKDSSDEQTVAKQKSKHITGYLNLIANIIDNFTHGLAVGGSFLVSFRLGALTTFAILIHEIPHEVGDFAILLRSGFNRWDAARAQLLTASGGIFGAMSAIIFSGGEVGAKTGWILPFTAGGFLHISMVTILPELLKETTNPKESLKQIGALLLGITIMAFLTILFD